MGDPAAARTRTLAMLGLVLLALWTPFRKDILSDAQLFWGLWQASVVFGLIWLATRIRPGAFRWSAARWAALAFWLAYVVAGLLAAASPRSAVGGVIRQGLYLILFLSASESVAATRRGAQAEAEAPAVRRPRVSFRPDSPETFLVGLWVVIALVAAANLLAVVGLLPFNVVQDGRLYTFTGYPNPVGALIGAGFLLGLGLRRAGLPAGRLGPPLWAVGQWLLLVAFLLIMSRGAWLVFPAGLAVLALLTRPGQRIPIFVDTVFLALAAVATAPFLARVFGQPAAGGALLAGGLLLAAACAWLARRFEALPARPRLLMVVGAFAACAVVLVTLVAAGAVPAALAHRLTAFSLAERSVWERLGWARDALRLAAASPVFGYGGGGWAARYWQYQSYNYYTQEVHNDFAQTLVETGVVGLAALVALLATLGWAAWRTARQGSGPGGRRLLVPAVAGATAMLTLHGLLDADFTLLVPGVVFWILLGVADGLTLPTDPERQPSRSARRDRDPRPRPMTETNRRGLGLLALAVALSLVAGSLVAARLAMREGVILSIRGLWSESVASLARACSFDPWSTEIRVQRALILEAAGMYDPAGAPDATARAQEQYEIALRLEPYDPNNHDTYGLFAMRNGMVDVGIREFEKALELQPFEALRYARAAEAHFALAFAHLRSGQLDESFRTDLERSVELRSLLAAQAAKVPAIVPPETALPAETPTLDLEAGKAQALLGRLAEAEKLLVSAHGARLCEPARETEESVPGRKFEAALWLSLIEEELGRTLQAQAYLQEIRSASPEADKLRAELGSWLDRAWATAAAGAWQDRSCGKRNPLPDGFTG